MKVKQRFFLDWINVHRARIRVNERVVLTATVLPDAAKSALALCDNTLMGAEEAAYLVAVEFFKETRPVWFDEAGRWAWRFSTLD